MPKRKPPAVRRSGQKKPAVRPACTILVDVRIDGRLLFQFPVKIYPNESYADFAFAVSEAIWERTVKLIPVKVYEAKQLKVPVPF